MNPLYGNGDGGDYWGVTVDTNFKEDLKMTSTSGDPSLYIIPVLNNPVPGPQESEAQGCMGVYVDDVLLAGNFAFQELTESTLQKFESRIEHGKASNLSDVQSKKLILVCMISLSQDYIRNIAHVPADSSFDQYRRLRAETA